MAITLTLTGQIVIEIIRGRNTISGNQSFYTAEAAVREGVYQVKDGLMVASAQNINNVSSSSIEINNNWPNIRVLGKANNYSTNRQVVYNLITFPDGSINYAVLSKSMLTMGGSSKIESTGGYDVNVLVEDDLQCQTPNKAYIEGDVFSPNANTLGATDKNVSGDALFASSIPTPTIDLSPSGPYYGSPLKQEFTAAAFNPNTDIPATPAIIIINGSLGTAAHSVKISGLQGTFLVNGNLHLGANSDIRSFGDNATLIVVGDLITKGAVYIEGVVYITGNFTVATGNTTIKGSVIALGDINTTGNLTIDFVPQENVGGIGDSYFPPKILGWQEE